MASIDSLGIQGDIVTPSSPSYHESIKRRSDTSVLQPSYIVYPTVADDISLALRFALSQTPPLEIAVKGGGCHASVASSSQGGLVIDLSRLNAVKVSNDKKTVAVQGGAVWGDVYSELEKHELVAVGGNVWFVGVGGLITGGGYSFLSGEYGLAVDNLLGATVALADGRIVKCNEKEEPDLFWAIRGGGNQFGIVTEFVLKTYPARGPALVGGLAYPGTELGNVLKVVQDFLKKRTPNNKINIAFGRPPPHFKPAVMVVPYFEGTESETSSIIAPFRTEITPVSDRIGIAPTCNAVSHGADAMLASVPPRALLRGALFSDLWDEMAMQVFEEWVRYTDNEETRATMIMWELGYGGKIAKVGVEETAFPVRDPHYYLIVQARHTSPESDAPARAFATKIAGIVNDFNEQKTGKKLATPANFAIGPDVESVQEVYGVNLERLRKVKAKYDPKKVWSKGWVIEPASE
ncbi:hypothetical protein BOTBODRAFT_29163 [Botryobasidium botryosum FD-172 SS1]|uniref:FAD-binding PCMH-type domain-containing protein n=1 Tax=Botryobasidium botryosum (strain FD-172 SS1) TaxID=930990 RepID=A0A067N161_BOTB1|nr:hypothetical protein BOTBODRAFT_29163 [Botryobasidium botryosum FD-172 SS1]